MNTYRWPWLFLLVLAFAAAGCKGRPKDTVEHDIQGKVIAIDPGRQGVTLEPRDTPAFPKARRLYCRLAGPELLESIRPGDEVQGRLEVRGVKPRPTVMVLTRLEKRP
jgi:hypothetical protein